MGGKANGHALEGLEPHATLTLACWISDDTDPALIKRWKEQTAPALFNDSADEQSVKISEIRFSELMPGEGRAGTPPDYVQGINVRLLVAECEVIGKRLETAKRSFISDLSHADLMRLREVTRRGAGVELSDAEADEVIERFGPGVAERILKSLADEK